MKNFITVQEIARELDITITTAYKLCSELKSELRRLGCRTVQGRLPRKFFEEKMGLNLSKRGGFTVNKVILMGRLTRDPEVRYSTGANAMAVSRYTLAVDRKFKRDGDTSADFISCVSFGKTAEFAEKYFRQGIKITISGRIQTGSYTNKEGQKIYTTEVVVEEQEFAESKKSNLSAASTDGFMNIPDGLDEELPFS